MKTRFQIGLGVGTSLALVALHALQSRQNALLWVVVYALAVATAVGGMRLPLFLRVFATGATAYLAYGMCLVARTMEPHFTWRTLAMAILAFSWCALLPTLALLRAWRGRTRAIVVGMMFPTALALASLVAAYEEHEFVRRHPQGIGPTARWTVSDHWLAYDAERRVLSGSD